MSDEFRSLFEASTAGIPAPAPSAATVSRRSRRIRATRVAAGIASFVAITAVAGILIKAAQPARLIQPVQEGSAATSDVDTTALLLIDKLGTHCRNYDFHFKTDVGGVAYRPVQCGGRSEIVPASDPPEAAPARGPTLVLYSFATETARRSWSDAHPALWAGRLTGETWIVDVMDSSVFGDIQARLTKITLRASEPPAIWRFGRHSMQAASRPLTPAVSLQEAAEQLTGRDQEVLGAQLGHYRDTKRAQLRPVPAWLITVRTCVPSYGGQHASPNCRGTRHHAIVDATTGARITTFVD